MAEKQQVSAIYAIKACKGAQISPEQSQKFTLLVGFIDAQPEGDERVSTEMEELAHFEFAEGDNADLNLEYVKAVPPEGTPERKSIDDNTKLRASVAICELTKLVQSKLSDIPQEQWPSPTEFLEVCCDQKVLIVGQEVLSNGQLVIQPANTGSQIKPECVNSYRQVTAQARH